MPEHLYAVFALKRANLTRMPYCLLEIPKIKIEIVETST